jgi:hypothetical protein
MKLFSKILILASSFAFGSTVLAAEPSSIKVAAPNQSVNNQSAVGSVNQSPVGGVNSNYQINNSSATDYGFGVGIYCRGMHLSVGGFGSSAISKLFNDNQSTFDDIGGAIALNIPLPSEVTTNCKKLAAEIVKQRQLDTQLNLIKQCALLKKEGIEFSVEAFPEFAKCESVKVTLK